MDERYSVVIVFSTSHALRIEKLLKTEAIPCRLIPVPRHLSSDCGVCVRIGQGDKGHVLRIIDETGIETEGIFDL